MVILGHFCPFTLLKTVKKKFEKMKKIAGDIIILHMCTKNHNHMMYNSWDMEWDRQNFLSFWAIFCPFTPLTIYKIKIFKKSKKKKKKNSWRNYWFTQEYHEWQSYHIWFLWYNFLSFWTIFCPLTPLTTLKIKIFKKLKKTPGDIIFLQMCTINDSDTIYGSWDLEHNRSLFCHFGLFFALLPH